MAASAEGNPGTQASRERNQNAILQSQRGREADQTRTKRRPHLVARERAVPGVAAGAGVLRELLLAPASERHTKARVSTRRQLPPAAVDPDASRQQERRKRICVWGRRGSHAADDPGIGEGGGGRRGRGPGGRWVGDHDVPLHRRARAVPLLLHLSLDLSQRRGSLCFASPRRAGGGGSFLDCLAVMKKGHVCWAYLEMPNSIQSFWALD